MLSLAGSVQAASREELDSRIRALTVKFDDMQKDPGSRIPADVLRKAKGIILINLTKGGFVFAVQTGGGVAMVRNKSDEWSPVAFIRSNEGSFGFQAGGEQSFCVLVLMNTNATAQLAKPTVNFGGVARGTAGDNSSGADGNFDSPNQSVLVYARRSGLYGGVAFKGGGLSADRSANEAYYGKPVTLSDILFDRKVEPTETATELAGKISAYFGK